MVKYKVAIVIPAFNEAETIFQVVKSVQQYGQVIVVNDASSDNTKQIAESSGALVVNHASNMGYDSALNSGFLKAKELKLDYIISFDADGQHSSHEIKRFIYEFNNGTNLVLGIRPYPARFSEKIFMYYSRYKFNWIDPLCGMKGYSMKLYNNHGCFDSIKSIGTELATYGLANNFSFIQINIKISERLDKPRFASIVKSNYLILRALVRLIIWVNKNN